MPVLNYEIEQASVAYLASVLPQGTLIVPGRNSGDKTLNLVICEADGDEQPEDPLGSGNFWVHAAWAVKGSSSIDADGVDPTPADVLLAGLVRDAWSDQNLIALLNSQGRQLTVQGLIRSAPQTGRDPAGVWTDLLPFKLYCCPSILAP